MSKILKDERGKFAKGYSANPKGREKGSQNKNTIRTSTIMQLAAQDATKAYAMLWEAMEAKEGWAYQLYFKELIPRKVKQATVLLDTKSSKVEDQISSLNDALVKFDEVTEDEIQGRLKTLTAIKVSDSIDNNTSEIKYSRDNLRGIVDKLNVLIDIKGDEEKEDEGSDN